MEGEYTMMFSRRMFSHKHPELPNAAKVISEIERVVGKETMNLYRSDREKAEDPSTFYMELMYDVSKAVKEIKVEDLVFLCKYASVSGFHPKKPLEAEDPPKFINETGAEDIGYGDLAGILGENVLQRLAMIAIVCIARDIVMQDQLQRRWSCKAQDYARKVQYA